jgi:hypothetical protein
LETHLLLAGRLGFLDPVAVEPALEQCELLGKMLRSFIRSLQRRDTEARSSR